MTSRNTSEINGIIKEVKQFLDTKDFTSALKLIHQGLTTYNNNNIDLLLLGGHCATQADRLDDAESYLNRGIDNITIALSSSSVPSSSSTATTNTNTPSSNNPLITLINQGRQRLLDIYKRKNNLVGQFETVQFLRGTVCDPLYATTTTAVATTTTLVSISNSLTTPSSSSSSSSSSTNTSTNTGIPFILTNLKDYISYAPSNEQCVKGESLRQIDLTIRLSLLYYQYIVQTIGTTSSGNDNISTETIQSILQYSIDLLHYASLGCLQIWTNPSLLQSVNVTDPSSTFTRIQTLYIRCRRSILELEEIFCIVRIPNNNHPLGSTSSSSSSSSGSNSLAMNKSNRWYRIEIAYHTYLASLLLSATENLTIVTSFTNPTKPTTTDDDKNNKQYGLLSIHRNIIEPWLHQNPSFSGTNLLSTANTTVSSTVGVPASSLPTSVRTELLRIFQHLLSFRLDLCKVQYLGYSLSLPSVTNNTSYYSGTAGLQDCIESILTLTNLYPLISSLAFSSSTPLPTALVSNNPTLLLLLINVCESGLTYGSKQLSSSLYTLLLWLLAGINPNSHILHILQSLLSTVTSNGNSLTFIPGGNAITLQTQAYNRILQSIGTINTLLDTTSSTSTTNPSAETIFPIGARDTVPWLSSILGTLYLAASRIAPTQDKRNEYSQASITTLTKHVQSLGIHVQYPNVETWKTNLAKVDNHGKDNSTSSPSSRSSSSAIFTIDTLSSTSLVGILKPNETVWIKPYQSLSTDLSLYSLGSYFPGILTPLTNLSINDYPGLIGKSNVSVIPSPLSSSSLVVSSSSSSVQIADTVITEINEMLSKQSTFATVGILRGPQMMYSKLPALPLLLNREGNTVDCQGFSSSQITLSSLLFLLHQSYVSGNQYYASFQLLDTLVAYEQRNIKVEHPSSSSSSSLSLLSTINIYKILSLYSKCCFFQDQLYQSGSYGPGIIGKLILPIITTVPDNDTRNIVNIDDDGLLYQTISIYQSLVASLADIDDSNGWKKNFESSLSHDSPSGSVLVHTLASYYYNCRSMIALYSDNVTEAAQSAIRSIDHLLYLRTNLLESSTTIPTGSTSTTGTTLFIDLGTIIPITFSRDHTLVSTVYPGVSSKLWLSSIPSIGLLDDTYLSTCYTHLGYVLNFLPDASFSSPTILPTLNPPLLIPTKYVSMIPTNPNTAWVTAAARDPKYSRSWALLGIWYLSPPDTTGNSSVRLSTKGVQVSTESTKQESTNTSIVPFRDATKGMQCISKAVTLNSNDVFAGPYFVDYSWSIGNDDSRSNTASISTPISSASSSSSTFDQLVSLRKYLDTVVNKDTLSVWAWWRLGTLSYQHSLFMLDIAAKHRTQLTNSVLYTSVTNEAGVSSASSSSQLRSAVSSVGNGERNLPSQSASVTTSTNTTVPSSSVASTYLSQQQQHHIEQIRVHTEIAIQYLTMACNSYQKVLSLLPRPLFSVFMVQQYQNETNRNTCTVQSTEATTTLLSPYLVQCAISVWYGLAKVYQTQDRQTSSVQAIETAHTLASRYRSILLNIDPRNGSRTLSVNATTDTSASLSVLPSILNTLAHSYTTLAKYDEVIPLLHTSLSCSLISSSLSTEAIVIPGYYHLATTHRALGRRYIGDNCNYEGITHCIYGIKATEQCLQWFGNSVRTIRGSTVSSTKTMTINNVIIPHSLYKLRGDLFSIHYDALPYCFGPIAALCTLGAFTKTNRSEGTYVPKEAKELYSFVAPSSTENNILSLSFSSLVNASFITEAENQVPSLLLSLKSFVETVQASASSSTMATATGTNPLLPLPFSTVNNTFTNWVQKGLGLVTNYESMCTTYIQSIVNNSSLAPLLFTMGPRFHASMLGIPHMYGTEIETRIYAFDSTLYSTITPYQSTMTSGIHAVVAYAQAIDSLIQTMMVVPTPLESSVPIPIPSTASVSTLVSLFCDLGRTVYLLYLSILYATGRGITSTYLTLPKSKTSSNTGMNQLSVTTPMVIPEPLSVLEEIYAYSISLKRLAAFIHRFALVLNPLSARAWNGLGISESIQSLVPQHAFIRSIELGGGGIALCNLGTWYIAHGRIDLASKVLLEAQTKDPNNEAMWIAKGLMYDVAIRIHAKEIAVGKRTKTGMTTVSSSSLPLASAPSMVSALASYTLAFDLSLHPSSLLPASWYELRIKLDQRNQFLQKIYGFNDKERTMKSSSALLLESSYTDGLIGGSNSLSFQTLLNTSQLTYEKDPCNSMCILIHLVALTAVATEVSACLGISFLASIMTINGTGTGFGTSFIYSLCYPHPRKNNRRKVQVSSSSNGKVQISSSSDGSLFDSTTVTTILPELLLTFIDPLVLYELRIWIEMVQNSKITSSSSNVYPKLHPMYSSMGTLLSPLVAAWKEVRKYAVMALLRFEYQDNIGTYDSVQSSTDNVLITAIQCLYEYSNVLIKGWEYILRFDSSVGMMTREGIDNNTENEWFPMCTNVCTKLMTVLDTVYGYTNEDRDIPLTFATLSSSQNLSNLPKVYRYYHDHGSSTVVVDPFMEMVHDIAITLFTMQDTQSSTMESKLLSLCTKYLTTLSSSSNTGWSSLIGKVFLCSYTIRALQLRFQEQKFVLTTTDSSSTVITALRKSIEELFVDVKQGIQQAYTRAMFVERIGNRDNGNNDPLVTLFPTTDTESTEAISTDKDNFWDSNRSSSSTMVTFRFPYSLVEYILIDSTYMMTIITQIMDSLEEQYRR